MSATVQSLGGFRPSRYRNGRIDRSWGEGAVDYRVVVIAASAGGIPALREVLARLPADFPLPVLIAQHRCASANASFYADILRYYARMRVEVACEGDSLRPATIYIPPAGCHLEIDSVRRTSILRKGRLNYVCPNADLLLTSAAAAFGDAVLAVVLSGYGSDGAEGVKSIRRAGGFVIAQDQDSAFVFDMPEASIETRKVDLVLSPEQIGFALCTLAGASDVALRKPTRPSGPTLQRSALLSA